MPFSEDRHTIKVLRESHQYGAARLMRMFPNKRWTLDGLKTLIKKLTVEAPWNSAMEAVDRTVRVATTTLMTSVISFSVTNLHRRLTAVNARSLTK